ncbi:MAG: tRNA (uridine(54)-C5)-methyltransferase TrmA [Gammaproteobacteria bacterium]|nr:MAG: tRNA (uridine(54)-C5)-methyltransferase TrmA [Gammaproteobacteria bacterium]
MNNRYGKQLQQKEARIRRQFASLLPASSEIEVFPSPAQHFRQRAEFRLWHERNKEGKNTGEIFYAMFAAGKKAGPETLQRVANLPIASRRINELMPQLLAGIKAIPCLLQGLFQVEFLSTLRGDTLVTLIYRSALDGDWQLAAKKLAKRLDVHLIGRSRRQKIVLSQDFVSEKLFVAGRAFHYRQIEGGFTQPNAEVCEKMLTWACQAAADMQAKKADLLELYCGNGNFTLPLSQYFSKVLATEVAKTSVQAARHNIAANGCDNIAIARLSAEELTQAFSGKRQFKRLAQDGIDVGDYHVKTIFVDPPRAGVDENTLKLMQGFENILYISCNPDTLYDNLQTLTETHKVERMALFDQFPYTHHIEMGVWLQRRWQGTG